MIFDKDWPLAKSHQLQIGRIFSATTARKIRMSGGNVYIRRNTSPRSVEEGKTVTTGRGEIPVREVEANEFDRKSFPCGSSLRAADAIYLRAITKSGRE